MTALTSADNVAAILFDFDGTLVHQKVDFALMRERVVALAHTFHVPEEMLAGRYVLELIDRITSALGEDGIRFARQALQAVTSVELEAAEEARPFDGVPEMLDALQRRGYRLAIITRNCSAAVGRALERFPLTHDVLLTRDDVPTVKPHPLHLLAALDELGVGPRQAVMVGDHPMDILAGRRIGAAGAIGVLPEDAPANYYDRAQPDFILHQVTELDSSLPERAAPVVPRRHEVLHSVRLYDGFFKLDEATLRYERFNGNWSKPHQRLLVERGDAVAVLPYDPFTRRVLLVRQFRYPALVRGESGWLWEAIAGVVDGGRTPEEVGRAEALEEAGYLLGTLEYAGIFFLSPGGCSERVSIYLAPLLPGMRRSEGGGLAEENEDILVRLFPFEQALQMVESGALRDAKTALALQYLALHADRLLGS